MPATIFVTQPVPESAAARLRGLGAVEMNPDPRHMVTKAELIAALQRNEYLVCLLHDRVDAEVIAASPRLRLIASMAITPAGVDVAAATARRIPVTTIPPLVTEATADLHWALLLAVARRVVEGDGWLRTGRWPGWAPTQMLGTDVTGKTLGIVGMGRIGQAVAQRAQGFRMNVLYAGRRSCPSPPGGPPWTRRSLHDVLKNSDFVSLHVPLTEATRHLIGPGELAMMKPTSFLLNTSRGPVIDEAALLSVLQTGRIAGAGLDVYEQEPTVHTGLTALPNVVLLPHLGSATLDTRVRMGMICLENIDAVVNGQPAPNRVM